MHNGVGIVFTRNILIPICIREHAFLQRHDGYGEQLIVTIGKVMDIRQSADKANLNDTFIQHVVGLGIGKIGDDLDIPAQFSGKESSHFIIDRHPFQRHRRRRYNNFHRFFFCQCIGGCKQKKRTDQQRGYLCFVRHQCHLVPIRSETNFPPFYG